MSHFHISDAYNNKCQVHFFSPLIKVCEHFMQVEMKIISQGELMLIFKLNVIKYK